MIKDIIVHTEKEFLEALKNIDENTLIIFDDGYPIKIDARDFENKRGLKYVKKRR